MDIIMVYTHFITFLYIIWTNFKTFIITSEGVSNVSRFIQILSEHFLALISTEREKIH